MEHVRRDEDVIARSDAVAMFEIVPGPQLECIAAHHVERCLRNPMYVAVVAVILGQGILFADWRLMADGGFMWLAFHAFVVTYEEPVLAQRFGTQYEDFRANVPRWIPRL